MAVGPEHLLELTAGVEARFGLNGLQDDGALLSTVFSVQCFWLCVHSGVAEKETE